MPGSENNTQKPDADNPASHTTTPAYGRRLAMPTLALLLLLHCLPKTAMTEEQTYPPDIERIRQRGKLIVALRPDSGPPLCSLDSQGEPKGIETDIARALAAKIGVELELNLDSATPAEALNLVRNRRADIAIANLTETSDRSLTTPFGIPYLVSRSSVLAKDSAVADATGFIDSSSALRNLNAEKIRIGVQEGSSDVDLAMELFPLAEISRIPEDWKNTEDALFRGEVDAAIMEDLRGTLLLRQRPELTVGHTLFIMKDREERICPAFHWQDGNLRLWYNAWAREWRTRPYDVAALLEEFPALFRRATKKER